MSTLKSIIFVLITLVTSIGCMSVTSFERPVYTGLDQIDNASATQLIGKWSAIELNPIANTDPQITFIEYKSDGTVNGIIPERNGLPNTPDTPQFSLRGRWVLEADEIIHREMRAQIPGDPELESILNQTLQNLAIKPSRANIYELSDNRIVMVGDDGKATEYTRQ